MRGQSARVLAVLDDGRETLKTLDSARASAEADLREAICQPHIDRALVRSLTAEIVNFSRQCVDDDEGDADRGRADSRFGRAFVTVNDDSSRTIALQIP